MTAIGNEWIIEQKPSELEFGYDASATFASSRDSLSAHEHVNVLGVKVSAINMRSAVELALDWISRSRPGYACVSSVHVIMEAQRNPKVLQALNQAAMNTPDGMPLTWVGRFQGHRSMDRVFGPDFMMEMCRVSVEPGYRHFLYGGRPGVAENLKSKLEERFPGIQIVGTHCGIYGASAEDEEKLSREIRQAQPQIVWVGLGAPYQELFMARFVERLQVPLMVGVGAAFDFHTGAIRDCSDWIKRAGLQWLHRLVQEPRRLWKRYLINNPAFLWQISRQLATSHMQRQPETSEYLK